WTCPGWPAGSCRPRSTRRWGRPCTGTTWLSRRRYRPRKPSRARASPPTCDDRALKPLRSERFGVQSMLFPDGSFPWPDGVRAAASFTFDVDAESCVLANDPGATDRMSLMGHQSYGPRVGTPRLLRLL